MYGSINGSGGDAGAGAASAGGTVHDTGDDAAYDSVERLWSTTGWQDMWGGGSSPGCTALLTTLSSGGTSSEGVGGGEPSPPGGKSSHGAHQLQATATARDLTHHERSTVATQRWAASDGGASAAKHGPELKMTGAASKLLRDWMSDCGVCKLKNRILIQYVDKLLDEITRLAASPGPADLFEVLNLGMWRKINQIRSVVNELGVHRKPKCERTERHVELGTETLVFGVVCLVIREVIRTQKETKMAVREEERLKRTGENEALKKKNETLQEENKELQEENKELQEENEALKVGRGAQDMVDYRAAKEVHRQLDGLAAAAALDLSRRRHLEMFKHSDQRPKGDGVSGHNTAEARRRASTGRGGRGRGRGRGGP